MADEAGRRLGAHAMGDAAYSRIAVAGPTFDKCRLVHFQNQNNMKKILVILAACAISTVALAQPGPGPHGPRDEVRHEMRQSHPRPHHKRKVWVPAHREHGRLVRGHYVWR